MTWAKGESGNPNGRAATKPWRDALVRALKRQADGDDAQALEKLADKCILMGQAGDMQAIKEIADRLDGRAIQPISGDSDDGALVVKIVRLAAEDAK